MKPLLYVIAVILLIGWLIGVFIYSIAGLIHILLILAFLAVIFNFFSGKKT